MHITTTHASRYVYIHTFICTVHKCVDLNGMKKLAGSEFCGEVKCAKIL